MPKAKKMAEVRPQSLIGGPYQGSSLRLECGESFALDVVVTRQRMIAGDPSSGDPTEYYYERYRYVGKYVGGHWKGTEEKL